jgi:hypothetical protein
MQSHITADTLHAESNGAKAVDWKFHDIKNY